MKSKSPSNKAVTIWHDISDDWQKLFTEGRRLDCSPSAHYIALYPTICATSASLMTVFGAKSVPMVAHLAYGWMPTILKYNHKLRCEERIFEMAQSNDVSAVRSCLAQIDVSPINNSWVGLSKTLHFMNPEVFPIWDSKIARLFGVTNISNKNAYCNYIRFIHDHKNDSFIDEAIENCEDWPNYHMSRVRTFELLLFTIANA